MERRNFAKRVETCNHYADTEARERSIRPDIIPTDFIDKQPMQGAREDDYK